MAIINNYAGDGTLRPEDKLLGSSYEIENGAVKYLTRNYTLGALAAYFAGFINQNGSTINITELITKIEESFGVVGDGDYSQALYEKIIQVIADEGYARVTALESLTATVQTNDIFARSNITRIDEVIATETFTRAQAITSLSSQFDTDLTSAVATINQTLTTYADADQALAQSITALDSSFTTDLTTAVAGINQTLTTLTTSNQALSQSVTTLSSSFEGLNTSVGSVTQTVTSLATDTLNLQSDVTILRSAFLYGAGGSVQDFDTTLRTKIQDLITAQTGLLPQDADLADVYASLNNFSTALGFLSSGFQLDAEGRPIGILNATLEDNLTAIAQAGVTLGTLGIDLLPEQVEALRDAFDINAQGEIIGLGTTLADAVAVDIQTTLTGEGFAYAADVDQLKTSLGVFDVNGNITSLSTGLTSQVTNVVTTTTGTIVSDVSALRAGYASYDPTTGEPTGFSDALKSDINTVIATADLASASSVSTLSASLQKIFRQDDAPATTFPVGSVWYDTNDNNKLYVLVDVAGTKTWVETSDTAKASVADVTTLQNSYADVNGRLSSTYGVTLRAGTDRVGGFKLSVDNAGVNNFIVRSDEFGVEIPGTGVRVMTVDDSGLVINGSGTFSGTVNATAGNFAGTLSGANITGATGSFAGSIITGGVSIGQNVESTYDGIYIDANNKWVNDGTIRFQVGNGTNSFRISESGAIGVNVSGQGMQFYNTTGGTEGMSFSSSSIFIKAIGVGQGDPGSLSLGAGYIQGNVTTGKINIVPTTGVDISGTLYASGSIQTAGNLAVTGAITAQGNITAYSTSDKRLKDNIIPISDAIDKINKIGGYEFDWNNNQEDFEGHDIGVIAQEIKEVMPEIVTERQDGYLAVRYEKIVALLIQGMKEQQIQIEELKNKLDGITG